MCGIDPVPFSLSWTVAATVVGVILLAVFGPPPTPTTPPA
jgi:hypothetical protein